MSDQSTEQSSIQFIEGINEGAECAEENFIQVSRYSEVAIAFTPAIHYNIVNIELFTIWAGFREQVAYEVKIYADHSDRPGSLVVTDGSMTFDAGVSAFGWKRIQLSKPILLIAMKKYWLGLESKQALYSLGRTEEGVDAPLRFRFGNRWQEIETQPKEKVMVRFYGKLSPNPS